MLQVVLKRGRVDNNIIQVNSYKVSDILIKHVIHSLLKCGWGITQLERHNPKGVDPRFIINVVFSWSLGHMPICQQPLARLRQENHCAVPNTSKKSAKMFAKRHEAFLKIQLVVAYLSQILRELLCSLLKLLAQDLIILQDLLMNKLLWLKLRICLLGYLKKLIID